MNLRELVDEIDTEEEKLGQLGAAMQDCERKLAGLRTKALSALGHKAPRPPGQPGPTRGFTPRKTISRVIDSLATGQKTVKEICAETGIGHHAVMAAIYYQTTRKTGGLVRWANRDGLLAELTKKGKQNE